MECHYKAVGEIDNKGGVDADVIFMSFSIQIQIWSP